MRWRCCARPAAGTVSGAPKARAMGDHRRLEPVKRGIYAGASRLCQFSRRHGPGHQYPYPRSSGWSHPCAGRRRHRRRLRPIRNGWRRRTRRRRCCAQPKWPRPGSIPTSTDSRRTRPAKPGGLHARRALKIRDDGPAGLLPATAGRRAPIESQSRDRDGGADRRASYQAGTRRAAADTGEIVAAAPEQCRGRLDPAPACATTMACTV